MLKKENNYGNCHVSDVITQKFHNGLQFMKYVVKDIFSENLIFKCSLFGFCAWYNCYMYIDQTLGNCVFYSFLLAVLVFYTQKFHNILQFIKHVVIFFFKLPYLNVFIWFLWMVQLQYVDLTLANYALYTFLFTFTWELGSICPAWHLFLDTCYPSPRVKVNSSYIKLTISMK